MKVLRGKPIAPGYGEGVAFVYSWDRELEIPRYAISPDEVESEIHRFQAARERSLRELHALRQRVMAEFGRSHSEIFETHLTILADQTLISHVERRIHNERINAEQAVQAEMLELTALFAHVKDPYLRERAQDIRDVIRRVLMHLVRSTGRILAHLPPDSVLVATELLPSDTLSLDRDRVVGIITEEGGETSHAAILARSLGLPAVTGIVDVTTQIASGDRVLVDGETGEITIEPFSTQTERFHDQRRRYDQMQQMAAAAESQECLMLDGVRIQLCGNIGRADEVDWVIGHHLDGVGLFRTEYLFLESDEPPSLQRQLSVYRQVVERTGDLPLVIRVLDLGGDKRPSFLSPYFETNPNLGLRGLRFLLTEGTLLPMQLEAILRAAGDRQLGILFPMVLGGDDFSHAVERLDQTCESLGTGRRPLVGAMIETPSSLFALEEILELADFVSIGTNDLTQFMLAADRNTAGLIDDEAVLHPSVLRAVHQVVRAAQGADRHVCVCGEAAGDPRIALLLVGLGVRELSMSPVRAARVRYALRMSSCQEAEALAQQALRCRSPRAVQQLIAQHEPAGSV